MKVTLTVHGKERDGEKFEFTEPGSLLFGRSERAQCRIRDGYVSREHFLLIVGPQDVRLRNLSDTNGTEVDGVLYTQSGRSNHEAEAQTLVKGEDAHDPAEAVLRNGSQIEVGYTRITVAIEADAPRKADMPVYCGDCGSSIPAAQKNEAKVERYYVCRTCRARRRRPGPSPPRPTSDRVAELIRQRFRLPKRQNLNINILGYDVGGKLAEGGMGLVFRGKRLEDGREVALKVIKPDQPITEEKQSRFRRETRIARELRHANIVEFIDGGETSGLFWLAMEFVEGGYDVAKHMRTHRGRIPVPEAVDLIVQTLAGLEFAHQSNGIIHRDIKPSNIMLVANGASYTAKLVDFGLAKSLEDAGLNGSCLTSTRCMGTLPYMPPEQAIDVRNAKPTADVFSTGATLYHMLTGRTIRKMAPNMNKAILQVIKEPAMPTHRQHPSIPVGLARVIHQSLELDAKARYQTASEFKEALLASAE